jgi:AraC-like DNA-binding protein
MEKLSLSIFNIFNILSLFAALIFIFQLYISKKNNKTKKYFSFYLISISIIITFFLIVDLEYKKPILLIFLPFFTFATLSIGPLLWFYVRSVVGGGGIRVINHLLIPFIFGFLSFLFLLLIHIDFNDQFSDLIGQLLTYLTIGGLTVAFISQNGYYLVKSFGLYETYLKKVGEVFSYTESVNLNWLKLVVYGYLVFILCLIISNLIDNVWSDVIFNSVLLFYIIYSGNNAVNYNPVFSDEVDSLEVLTTVSVNMKSDFFVQLKKSLEVLMLKDKLYLNDALTIHSLATILQTNSKYLSQLINTEFNKSFVVYINEFRVEEAKKLLLDESTKHLTIEAIGYESGFKSKSAFNSVFKKNTGETPSSFLKKRK